MGVDNLSIGLLDGSLGEGYHHPSQLQKWRLLSEKQPEVCAGWNKKVIEIEEIPCVIACSSSSISVQAKLLPLLLREYLERNFNKLDVIKVHKHAVLAAEVPSNVDALVLQVARASNEFHGKHGIACYEIVCC